MLQKTFIFKKTQGFLEKFVFSRAGVTEVAVSSGERCPSPSEGGAWLSGTVVQFWRVSSVVKMQHLCSIRDLSKDGAKQTRVFSC